MKKFARAALAAFLLTGCAEERGTGIPGREPAPPFLTMASKPPRLANFPGFREGGDFSDKPPPLPPLRAAPNGMPALAGTAVQVGNAESPTSPPPAQATAEMQPIEQLIYGGNYPEHDSPGDYRLNVRDKIHLAVEDHPEFSGDLQVQQDGSVRLPNTDDWVSVAGLTTAEAEKALANAVAPYIKGKPRVRVTIVFGRGECYYIFGEVQNQGRFSMGLKPIRLSEAIFRANSTALTAVEYRSYEAIIREQIELGPRQNYNHSKYALLTQVSVITPHRSRPLRQVYNVKAALLEGKTGQDPVIQPGQIIIVPSAVDKRIMEFCRRVVAPLKVVGQSDAEVSHWYGRITGNSVKGVKPAEYKIVEEALTTEGD
ncbi:MAG: polysaccharide biosynthesis/export family protein [Planctomycetota bacterium]|nr:polysaccharide biosynthesis/export family protein [Planctomycetota bacterium]